MWEGGSRKNLDGCVGGDLHHSFYLLSLRFLLLAGGTDIGEVGNNLLRVLCLACTGLTAALEQRDQVR